MDPFTLMLLIGGVVSLISGGIGTAATIHNTNAQKAANDANVSMQKEANAQQQYNLEHAHQIEMADLEAAGLNPTLTAMGGSGASTTSIQAPKQQPVQSDLSGVQSALAGMQSLMSTMMMYQMMEKRIDMMGQNNIRTTNAYNQRTSTWHRNSRSNGINPENAKKAGQNSFSNAQALNEAVKDAKSILGKDFSKNPKKALEELSRIAKIPWLKK